MRRSFLLLALSILLAVPAMPASAADPAAAPSVDGPWTIAELTTAAGDGARVGGVAAGPDGLVAIGGHRSRTHTGFDRAWGDAWTSPDGVTWTATDPFTGGLELGRIQPVLSGPEVGLLGVAYGPGGFIVLGRVLRAPFTTQRVAVWRSADGTAWEPVTTDAFPAGSRPATVIGTATGYLAGGVIYGDRAPRGAIWWSADGLTWTRATDAERFGVGGYIDTMEDPASGGIRAIAGYGDGAVATGLACFPSLDERTIFAWGGRCWGEVWISPDGRTWSQGDVPQTLGEIGHVATLGTRIVAAAEICSGCPSAILVSDDGATWTFPYGSPVGGELVSLVAVADGFRALLRSEQGALAVWSSADGGDWEAMAPLPALPDGTVAGRAAMTVSGDRLVIVAATWDDVPRSFAISGPAAG